MSQLSSPPLICDAKYALFLDIDGTLAPISERPALARIPVPTLEILKQLYVKTHGAVAIISGRNINEIDRLLAPHIFPAAGQHGLELRFNASGTSLPEDNQALMEVLAAEISVFHIRHPKLLVEYKGFSIALHYRNAPELENAVHDFLSELAAAHAPSVLFQKGKRVGEIRLSGTDKGKAIARLLETAPFAGRIPVFAGDDTTDEEGFAAVNAQGGISIKVGEGETLATYRVRDTSHLQEWLKAMTANEYSNHSERKVH